MNTPNEAITPLRLVRALQRRRKIAIWTVITFLIAGVVACLFFPRSYASTGMIRVARGEATLLGWNL